MPRYLIERTVGSLTAEQIEAGSRRSMEVIAETPGLVWIRSYVSDIDGKIYCEYEAPNPEAIREQPHVVMIFLVGIVAKVVE